MIKVLIIDDQPTFRRQLSTLLSYAGMTVIGEASDISTAEKIAKETQPDIAVIDVMLPGENGLSGTKKLKALVDHLRVFLISAHHDSADLFMKSAEDIGAEAFISKDELDLDLVKRWIDQK
jgi:two-component system, OmpR family, response regulator